MVRFLLNVVASLVSSAVALLLTGWLVGGVSLQAGGFLAAVGVFTLAQAILSPFVLSMARKYASAILGGVGLVSTLLSLFVATLFPDGLRIRGFTDWVAAVVLVWLVTALGNWALMALIVDRKLLARGTGRGGRSAG